MIKKQNGITLVSLIIVIVLMLIISSTVVNVSLDRFEINNFNKMKNDIELLKDKVSNYYLKYNGLPVIRDENNEPIEYTYTDFDLESGKYYILDLSAMEGVSLNYGKLGFENPNTTKDVYVINQLTYNIYYVKGIELQGSLYHYINNDTVTDTIPPSKPSINVISGVIDDNGTYLTEVKIELVAGKDGWAEIDKTTYSINNSTETDVEALTNNIYNITEDGTYEIKARTYDKNGNISEYSTKTITVNKKTIVLDKTELSLIIGDEGTATAELTATLENVSKDLKWKSSEDSGIIISGEGNTKTITATKKIENATITVSYGTISTTCIITVTEQ